MMIRIARYEDLSEIMIIVKETIEDLQNEGNYQWSDNYPSYEQFETDIKHAELYVDVENNEVAGFICINKKADLAYELVKWTFNLEAIIIHRFAVKRKYQRMHIGTKLIEFVEEFALNNGVSYLKVDTNSKNRRMNAFFKYHNFNFIGTIHLRGLKDEFNCYEKKLGKGESYETR